MKISNTYNSTNFKGKFYLAGIKNPTIISPAEALQDALISSAEASNKIIDYYMLHKIPYFIHEYTVLNIPNVIPQKIGDLPDLIVLHSFLTGVPAVAFKNAVRGRKFAPKDMFIPRENAVDAAGVLAAIERNTFDYLSGEILTK